MAPGVTDYLIGAGDQIDIDVFQADELDRTVRVRPDGTIFFPLLGVLQVGGVTTADLEALLAERLGEAYLNAPQISVFVSEYRAHPVSILGAVNAPGVHYMRQPRSLVSMLSESGGLTDDAGETIQLRRRQHGPDGESVSLLTIDIGRLLDSPDRSQDLMLQDDDTIFVPKAGVVFVEGAVARPGAYELKGSGTVLKAVTLAGGIEFISNQSVQVVRAGRGGPELLHVDLAAIKADPSLDIVIGDGDVVIVGTSIVKLGLVGLWRGIAGLVRVSTGF